MQIGNIHVQPGEKVFGYLTGPQTHGGFTVQVPLHIIAGATPGPMLVVQAGLSGLEIEPAMVLPAVVEALDPAQLKGTLVVIPLFNSSGFEFEQENAAWDNKNLNTLGRGRATGSVSEQLLHTYYTQVIASADALIDIHTGALWGYFRYAGVYAAGDVDRSRGLAVTLGLPEVLIGQPEDQSLAYAAAQDGKVVVSAWIGGGPGLRDHREADLQRVMRAVLNAARHLGMLDGPIEVEVDTVAVVERHTVITVDETHARGMIFMDKGKRSTLVAAGEQLGYVRHPFTGKTLETITAPKAGIMLHAGAAWPMLPEGALLAILGVLADEVTPG